MHLYFSKIADKLRQNSKYVKLFFVIFYFVGVVGMLNTQLQPLFFVLIPFALLLSFFALLIFHQAAFDKKTISILFIIYLLGYFIEVIGVNTGIIFGNYIYGGGLGFKILNTPLMIGINWVMLVYCSASIFEKMQMPVILKIILASLLMLLYDVILENIAPIIDMWSWTSNLIPLQNYIAWFIIAFLFQSLVKLADVKIQNKIAITILTCQAIFFLVLIIFFNFVK